MTPGEADAVRARFDPEQGGGWHYTAYEQVAPDGGVIGSLTLLCCPLCGAAVSPSSEEHLAEHPEADWPALHVEHHARLAGLGL